MSWTGALSRCRAWPEVASLRRLKLVDRPPTWPSTYCMLRPPSKLQDVMDLPSELRPTLITDAKALYDSYYKEGGSSLAVDKGTGLEIRVAKEQMAALGGTLRWVSSERQYADGLTKSSTRKLLAERLRYGKLKLVWDPSYTSAKRKDAQARELSRNEFAKVRSKTKDVEHNLYSTHSSTSIHTSTCNLHMIAEETAETELPPSQSVSMPVTLSMPAAMFSCLLYFSQIKGATADEVAAEVLPYQYPWNVLSHWLYPLVPVLVAFLSFFLGWRLGTHRMSQLTLRLSALAHTLETTRDESASEQEGHRVYHETRASILEERLTALQLEHDAVVRENQLLTNSGGELRVWLHAAVRDLEHNLRFEDQLQGQLGHAGALLTRALAELDELEDPNCHERSCLRDRIQAYVDEHGSEDYTAFFDDASSQT